MSRLVEFDTADGGTVFVESTVASAGEVQVSAAGERAADTIEGALARIGPVMSALKEQLAAARPSEVTAEFGIKLNGKAGAILASSSGEVNFRVTMRWAPGTTA